MTEQKIPMTPAGYAKLRAELKQIKEVDRPENVRDIETALGHGDLRENAEYHAAKERQAQLDARMRYLESRLGMAQVIDPETLKEDKVTFGATVTLLDLDSDQRVVGAPIARAMLGKRAGDEVLVKLPKGDREYEVVKIEYKAIP